ncbi:MULTISPECIES: response regulator transcription factor [Hoeflea]|uniref:Response regulator n=1 Tax=Hoeflea alexandrii TaxID=288436 RepID=A0ABT1CP34_9HYPH|nr:MULTISPECIES: response regulator transcription factor [Hoeflea]MCO6407678.1 response regulator [Hoeflea alexandrii]MCY0153940.1 response regulator transcription factor [Hoeflea alexandrii]VVT09458.1 Transcriptional regulatory protein QseB [Hoeflea sp. EC-HK425]
MRILLVEDDQRIRQDVTTALEAAGFVVDSEANGEEGWFLGDSEAYAAAILDLGLPGMDGLTVLKRWRAEGRDFPVLVLTARGAWTERVEGIDAGADDYLPKPFRMEELVARLRAIIRRSGGQANPVVIVGDAELDTRQMRLSVRGVPVSLSPQEYRLVAYLMLHKGRVVSQQELSEHLQSVHFERESNAVEVLVGRVRRKLPAALIETRRGFGYIVNEPDGSS